MDEKTLLQLFEKALNEPPYDNPRFPPSLYYRFFKVLAAYMEPSLSVELGVCGGGGSLHLALGYPEGQVVGVDLAYDHPQNIETIMQTCPNFTFWQGDSVDVARDVYEAYGPCDLLFIDTVHEKTRTLLEYETWKPFLSDRAIVCFDDLFRPGMPEVWKVLPGNKLRLDRLHDGAECGGGFGVIWGIR